MSASGTISRSAGYQITSAGSPANQVGYGINREKNINGVNYVSGKTIGIVINQDTNPWQMWVTPDISNRSGCGGGPVWNGSNTSSPVPALVATAHYPCGGPGTGGTVFTGPTSGETGLPFFVPGVSPAMTGQFFGGQNTVVTFNFGANATLDALIGIGRPRADLSKLERRWRRRRQSRTQPSADAQSCQCAALATEHPLHELSER